jgi:hypothetical protein
MFCVSPEFRSAIENTFWSERTSKARLNTTKGYITTLLVTKTAHVLVQWKEEDNICNFTCKNLTTVCSTKITICRRHVTMNSVLHSVFHLKRNPDYNSICKLW